METYELVINEKDVDGVMAISLVEAPAIDYNFIALSKNKIDIKAMDEQKMLVIGLALVPEMKIRRIENGKEFNIFFSKETVREVARLYLKNSRTNNTTVEHEKVTTGAHLAESWIVDNPKMDKIVNYNMEVPEGSWAVAMKVTDTELWEEIKNGKYLGFSIEGRFERTQSADDKLSKIVDILKEYGD